MTTRPHRRRFLPAAPPLLLLALLAVALSLWPAARGALAQQMKFFQIGTGSTGEAHFPIGGLIANAISNPPGSRDCAKGGSCGVPGLIAVAQSTNGSVSNIEAIAEGRLEAALTQADLAYWAFNGTGFYKGKGRVDALRAIAMLYPDSLHLVARKDSGIASVKDLRGKRVSLGEEGSGTLVDARIILQAHGLKDKDIKAEFLRPSAAADRMMAGELDAFFLIDAPPVPLVGELAKTIPVALVPLAGAEAETLRRQYPFFLPGEIAAGTYAGQDQPVPTLDVGVVLLVGAQVDPKLVHGITQALWHPSTQKMLREGHPRGRMVKLEAATERMGVDLHPGAAAYYFETGMVR